MNQQELHQITARLQGGQVREALAICSSVLKADHRDPDAWHLLSKLQNQIGNIAEALKAAQRAVELAPDRPDMVIQLGICLGADGDIPAALAAAERASLLTISSAATHSNLGALFSFCGDHGRAAECFRAACDTDSTVGTYWFNLASSLRALGNLDEADRACTRAIDLNPLDGQAWYLLSDLRVQTPQANHVRELQSLILATEMKTPDRILCGFALAKELEDLGDYESSFACLTKANRAYRDSITYDVQSDIAAIDEIIASHTASAIQDKGPGYEIAAPIFIVGFPRSGTTLTERLVQSHSQVHSVGERNDFALIASRLTAATSKNRKLSRLELINRSLRTNAAELGSTYIHQVSAKVCSQMRIVDKMPVNYLYCGLIAASLPNAKIVALSRNAMDNCYAAYKAFLRGPYSFTFDLQELGQYFLAFKRLTRHWQETLPEDRYMDLNYEALVTNTESEVKRLFNFLALPWEQEVLSFHTTKSASSTASAAQIRRTIYTTSIGKWEHYRTQLRPLAEILGVDTNQATHRPQTSK